MKNKVALAAVLALALLPLQAELGSASFEGGNGKIAFSRYGTKPGIRIMNADGSGVFRFTTGDDGFAQWSPDGTRVAFLRWKGMTGETEIGVKSLDGSVNEIVSSPSLGMENGCGLQRPQWSYDGEYLLYADDCFDAEPRVAQLRVVTADGSDEILLTDYVSAGIWAQAWSPVVGEGGMGQIVYTGVPEGEVDSEVFVVNQDGTGTTRLTDDDMDQLEARWSPAGTSITFVSQMETNDGMPKGFIETMEPSGQGREVLVEGRYAVGGPLWSPDGSMLAFNAYTLYGKPTLKWISVGGGAPTKVGRWLELDAWTPNSAAMLVIDEGDIVKYKVSNGAFRRLTTTKAYETGADQQVRSTG